MIGLPEHIEIPGNISSLRYRSTVRCNWSGDSVSVKAWASAQSSMCMNALSAMVQLMPFADSFLRAVL